MVTNKVPALPKFVPPPGVQPIIGGWCSTSMEATTVDTLETSAPPPPPAVVSNIQLLNIHLIGGDKFGSRKRTKSRRNGLWLSWLGESTVTRRVQRGLRRLKMDTRDNANIIARKGETALVEEDMMVLEKTEMDRAEQEVVVDKQPRDVLIQRRKRNGLPREEGVRVRRIDDLLKFHPKTVVSKKRNCEENEDKPPNRKNRKFGQ